MQVLMIYVNMITDTMPVFAGINNVKSITLNDKNAIVIYESGSEMIWERQFIIGYSVLMNADDFLTSLDKKRKRR